MNRKKIVQYVVIVFLIIANIYLYFTKAIPGALNSSIDLRYGRASEFINHMWAGLEEFPSMICCILPLALFPTVEAARLGWLMANVIFLLIILLCFRRTFFKDLDRTNYIIWSLLFSSSVPVIMTFINGQNLLFSFAFFMMAYVLSEENDKKSGWLSLIAGVLLGISFFKYSVIFFILPIFLYKKRYRELITSVLMHVVLTLFSAYWLDMSLLNILISPIISSVGINTGRGYIDLMTIFNSELLGVFPGGDYLVDILINHNGKILYYPIVIISFIMIMIVAIRGEKCEQSLIWSLYSVLSVTLIYHRQYDYFVLVLPFFFGIEKMKRLIIEKQLPQVLVLGITVMGMACILWGNWLFKICNLSIEYGLGCHLFYCLSIVGLYGMCIYLMIEVIRQIYKNDVKENNVC